MNKFFPTEMRDKDYKIYPKVKIGKNVRIDKGVILGFSETKNYEETIIGDNAIIRANTVIYSGVRVGKNFQTGPGVLIREGNIIGDDVAIWHNATLSPGNIIGDGCRIHAGSFLELVKLGKRIFIGPSVIFTDDPHPINPSPRKHFGGAQVDDDAVIGAAVTILPHVKIGRRAIIGAGSVVTKDVGTNQVWLGNPARFVKNPEDIVCKIDKRHYPYREFWKDK